MADPRRERDPKQMSDLLRTLVAGRGWGERMSLGRLRESWADVVGELVASRSEPLKLFRGTLTVRADPGAWATELTLLSSALAEKADSFLGGGAVREVRVNAAPGRSAGI